jgi:hypothetical protein
MVARIWIVVVALALGGVGLVAGPLAYGWQCYRLHATGERVASEVVAVEPGAPLVLRIRDGARAGHHCTAKTSESHLARLAPGDPLEVVVPDGRPDECVLVATLENSAALLWGIGGGVAMLVLMLVAAGVALQRSFTRRLPPTTRLDLPSGGLGCPRCDAPMSEGYLPLLAGLHWREPGEPVGLPHALSGLPGTVGWRGRPRLHAYRCAKCEIVTFQYGAPTRGRR